MPVFLFEAKCLAKGMELLLREGGTKRAANIFKIVESQGGKCKTVYFGTKAETFAIASMPNAAAALAVQRMLDATGTMEAKMCPLQLPAKFLPESENLLSWDCFAPQKMPCDSMTAASILNKTSYTPPPPIFVRPFAREHAGW